MRSSSQGKPRVNMILGWGRTDRTHGPGTGGGSGHLLVVVILKDPSGCLGQGVGKESAVPAEAEWLGI